MNMDEDVKSQTPVAGSSSEPTIGRKNIEVDKESRRSTKTHQNGVVLLHQDNRPLHDILGGFLGSVRFRSPSKGYETGDISRYAVSCVCVCFSSRARDCSQSSKGKKGPMTCRNCELASCTHAMIVQPRQGQSRRPWKELMRRGLAAPGMALVTN